MISTPHDLDAPSEEGRMAKNKVRDAAAIVGLPETKRTWACLVLAQLLRSQPNDNKPFQLRLSNEVRETGTPSP